VKSFKFVAKIFRRLKQNSI